MKQLAFALRQVAYDLQSGLLFRPGVILLGCAGLAVGLPPAERVFLPALSARLATEPSTAQVVLSTLAGSMMTVVSVVYSILLVALSLASMQFSTRVLALLMRDRVSQNTLGLFVGTFVYCLLTLRTVHTEPAYVPGVALGLGLALALGSLAALVYFIHHIVRGIQANHLVDRIATETEAVIDEVFVAAWDGRGEATVPSLEGDDVLSATSGYVQLVNVEGLRALATGGRTIVLLRPMGSFVPEGAALFRVTSPVSEAEAEALRGAIDVGPVRTMQQDVEYGIRQIVDVALKAISPAVNDPSTAATCIDHLSRLLVRVGPRAAPPIDHGGVYVPAPTHGDLVDLAFEQIRQYARSDMAVALRLMRAFGDIAGAMRSPAGLARVEAQARLVEAAARAHFAPEECDELARRRAVVASRCEQAAR